MDFRLPWSEIDPRRRATPDLEAVRKRARSALRRKASRTSRGAEGELKFLLWSELGAWSDGWHDPVARGGASRVWEGPASIAANEDETVERVVAAIEGWQAWLEELAQAFDGIAAATKELDEVDAIARAAAELLPLVVERTGAQGDWARTYAKATSWCAQACDRANEDVAEHVLKALEGKLEAGAAPEGAAAQDLVEELALEVAVRERPPFTDDALEAWWVVRASALWGNPTTAQRPNEVDGHRAYIRHHDRPRSSKRADAMTRALVRARYGATKQLKIDLALLREWLELALVSGDLSLRRGEKVAADGGERYGCPKDLEARLAQALDDAMDERVPAVSRAARVYMDLMVLCPFKDGNWRLARLALDHVLARDGLALHDGAPVFSVRRWAHDKGEPWRFQRALAACSGRT